MARHKEFDKEEVLQKAMDLFWEQGYEATSIQDLVRHMGINRGSLYDTFGDKHSLFLSALDCYGNDFDKQLQTLTAGGTGVEAIRNFFRDRLQAFTSTKGCKGCLMTNSTVELGIRDPEAAAKVTANLLRLEHFFHQALLQAQKQQEVGENRDIRALARFFANSTLGLSAIAKTSPSLEVLEDIVGVTLAVLQD